MANEYSDEALLRDLETWALAFTNRSVREAMDGIRRQYQPALEAAFAAGDAALINEISEKISTKFAEAIQAAQQQVYMESGRRASQALRTVGIELSFTGSDPRAEKFIRESSSRMITEISNQQRLAIRARLAESFERGVNPRKAAKELIDIVGLTARQQAAVANYRRLLEQGSSFALERALRDPSMDALVRRGNLSSRDIDRMVRAYERNYVRYRTEMIARTEMLAASNEAVQEAYQQGVDSGDLDPEKFVRQWKTARDERVRGSHRSMHNQVRDAKEPFVTGSGYRAMYPHDPALPAQERVHCRCITVTRYRAIVEEEQKP